ncbi:NADH-quinone oxidoreductase subunit B family protein [Nitratifractor salsuginis]|uniref:NADH ubiquinone oxidoreductase 20 kDa subunit n=1 Tax=Nitratifractor salsuginis (strain DSM 16511 / JCM 12458 / E9I37-1) TaxID=749222 RepID=E6X219_NITSE|nr:hydrogenase [Nitratifractor salsuginis]ADV47088.1 NADH ubiquinone oxidoreductase 20 kDa subunit [Nitratifractor salsuginis DSM 16511]
MLKYWQKRFQTGVLTEHPEFDERMKELRKRLRDEVKRKFAGSLAIRMVDSGSCNACEAECNALSNPYYDLERLGIHFVASPRHADLMLLSGVLTFNMLPHVLDAWEQIPEPKWCITLGDCPAMQAPFEHTFAVTAPASEHLPVAHHIPGCPPSPDRIIEGLLEFLENLES